MVGKFKTKVKLVQSERADTLLQHSQREKPGHEYSEDFVASLISLGQY